MLESGLVTHHAHRYIAVANWSRLRIGSKMTTWREYKFRIIERPRLRHSEETADPSSRQVEECGDFSDRPSLLMGKPNPLFLLWVQDDFCSTGHLCFTASKGFMSMMSFTLSQSEITCQASSQQTGQIFLNFLAISTRNRRARSAEIAMPTKLPSQRSHTRLRTYDILGMDLIFRQARRYSRVIRLDSRL